MVGPWQVRFVAGAQSKSIAKGEGIWNPHAMRRLSKDLGYLPWPEFGAYGDDDATPPLGFHVLCPYCFSLGSVYVRQRPGSPGPTWEWNGSWDKPTLSPSILFNTSYKGCGFHCFVRDGQIIDAGTPPHGLEGDD